jgi:hypothetical protein
MKLYFASVQIIQLEESIVQLKEDLALERDEAIEEKERLNKAVVRCCTIKHLSDRFIRPKSPSLDFNTLH